eukprot:CAMPEP_0173120544 /NCGR_PEP_ID=MMETSP1102-20130122/52625_1 /TAXON_ID=49646 /ORGANISM="Geminigera sp., Strain Caron Lab Isolate" /LENGTH=444 /DNA_ID=CAMNT_0014026723 /DNA_START=289 /DNA_END=1623 /DNA_ORIENTATION=+
MPDDAVLPNSTPLQKREEFMMKHREQYIERRSLRNCFLWTLYILLGATVACPKSMLAQCIRGIGRGLQRVLFVLITAVAATVLTTESLLAQASKVTRLSDLANRKICAIQNTEGFQFLQTQTQIQLNVIKDITTPEEMFWLFEQFPDGGSRTCEAIVYDWPLLQVGYIYNGVLNTTRMKTCIQCPDQSVLVGTALNADPYGIAMASQHPLYDYMKEKTWEVIRDIEFRNNILRKWKLNQDRIDYSDMKGDWGLFESLALYYVYAFAGVLGLLVVWLLTFRMLRSKLDLRKIDAALHDADTTDYLLWESAQLDASEVCLSEDFALTHAIRLQLNRVQAAVAHLMRHHDLFVISAPGHVPDQLNQEYRKYPHSNRRGAERMTERERERQGQVHELAPAHHPPAPPTNTQPKMIYVDTKSHDFVSSLEYFTSSATSGRGRLLKPRKI